MAKKIAFTRRLTKPILDFKRKQAESYKRNRVKIVAHRKEKYNENKLKLIRELLNNENDEMIIKRFNCKMTNCINFNNCQIANKPSSIGKIFIPKLKYEFVKSLFSHIKIECKSFKKERVKNYE